MPNKDVEKLMTFAPISQIPYESELERMLKGINYKIDFLLESIAVLFDISAKLIDKFDDHDPDLIRYIIDMDMIFHTHLLKY